MAGGRADEPLDLGTIELKAQAALVIGGPAPAFEAPTFDGKTLKMADYRGKYVLIDFWATWCGPCIAEMKHLEKIHQATVKEGRLVIISMSTDDRMDEPAKFLQARKLPWLQAWAGDLSPAPAHRIFEVRGIPSVWLIDPEGKIVARDMYGEKIDEVLAKAMGGR
jgi:thiol-disulfide isomerase/thioredoxin